MHATALHVADLLLRENIPHQRKSVGGTVGFAMIEQAASCAKERGEILPELAGAPDRLTGADHSLHRRLKTCGNRSIQLSRSIPSSAAILAVSSTEYFGRRVVPPSASLVIGVTSTADGNTPISWA